MGENQALVWLLLGTVIILALAVIFSDSFNIHAFAFFGGVS